ATARAGAALALGRIGTKTDLALPALTAALNDEEPRVRATATAALAQYMPASGEALAAADAEEPEVAIAGPEAVGSSHQFCHDEEAAAVDGIKLALAKIAVPALVRLLDRRESAPRAAAALQKYGTEAQSAVPALVAAYPAGGADRLELSGEDAITRALTHI